MVLHRRREEEGISLRRLGKCGERVPAPSTHTPCDCTGLRRETDETSSQHVKVPYKPKGRRTPNEESMAYLTLYYDVQVLLVIEDH